MLLWHACLARFLTFPAQALISGAEFRKSVHRILEVCASGVLYLLLGTIILEKRQATRQQTATWIDALMVNE